MHPIAPGHPTCASPRTEIKLLYDSTNLYIGAYLYEPHICGSITTDNVPIFMDNDFEVFLDPDGSGREYFEFEVNALGASWQLSLDRPYSEGGSARSPHTLPGLVSKVHVDGSVNDPSDVDIGWSVTLKIPFVELQQFGANAPPVDGDRWKVNFSRVQWEYEIVEGKYVRVPPVGTSLPQGPDQWHPEKNFVWAPTGVVDIHVPSKWGVVVFEE